MQDKLISSGILASSGDISKDKINLISGAITLPFAEMVWVTTGGDMDTINRLTEMLVSMNTPKERGRLFQIIQMLYGLMGLEFSEETHSIRRSTSQGGAGRARQLRRVRYSTTTR